MISFHIYIFLNYESSKAILIELKTMIYYNSIQFSFINIAPNHNNLAFRCFILYGEDPTITQDPNIIQTIHCK